MGKSTKIIVMGAGAVGAYFGGCLASSDSNDMFFIARGAHLKAIQKNGIQVKSVYGDFNQRVEASDSLDGYRDTADIILFTVKSYDTKEAMELIRPKIGENTQILTIQNGLENFDKLEESFGADRVIQGICRIGAMVESPGVIRHSSMGSIIIGEYDGTTTERVKFVKHLFDQVNVDCRITDNIKKEVWTKFIWNSVFNMLTAAAGVTTDKIFEKEPSKKLSFEIFREISLVASEYGIDFTENDYNKMATEVQKLGAFKTSTYQDRVNGKRLEYKAFTGVILRMGKEKGLHLPYNEALYGLISLID